MAMADLASNSDSGPISLTEISLRQNISLAYLEQIFLNPITRLKGFNIFRPSFRPEIDRELSPKQLKTLQNTSLKLLPIARKLLTHHPEKTKPVNSCATLSGNEQSQS